MGAIVRPKQFARVPDALDALAAEALPAPALPPFPTAPSRPQLEHVFRAIRETARPEGVPSISWTKPDKSLEHVLYFPIISVDRWRRGGEMVPCSLCSGENPKCLSFYLLWSSDGHLRVVGCICGPTYFGGAEFEQMEQEARRVADRETNRDFLLTHLPNAHAWFEDLKRLQQASELIVKVRIAFETQAPTLLQKLRKALRDDDGALVVVKTIDQLGGVRSSLTGTTSNKLTLTVARIRGRRLIDPHFDPMRELGKIVAYLAVADCAQAGPPTEDAVLERVVPMDDRELIAACASVRDAHKRAARLAARLEEAAQFLGETNIAGLERWTTHPDSRVRFAIERNGQGVRFTVRYNERIQLPTAEALRPPTLHALGAVK